MTCNVRYDASDMAGTGCEQGESLKPRSPTPSSPSPASGDSSASAEVAAVYEQFHALLFWVCTAKFNVPADAAEASIHEVMLSFMQAGTHIENIRAWLVAATCNACRAYWRSRAHHELYVEPTADLTALVDGHDLADAHERESLVRDILLRLSDRQRQALRLHYFEGCTAREVAERLNTTARYAEKLIHKSLMRCRRVLQEMCPAREGSPPQTGRHPAPARHRGDRRAEIPTTGKVR